MSTPEQKPTSERLLYLKLREQLRSGVILPGARMMEVDLCKTHGVGRSVVRAVLRRLAAEGLVKIEPYKGATVPVLSLDEIVSLLDIREVLEGLTARLACRLITAEETDELHRIVAKMDEAYHAIDVFEWQDLNADLHSLIAHTSCNYKLQELVESLMGQTVRYAFASILTAGRMLESQVEHRELIAAICSEDPDAAEEAARRHVNTVKRNLLNMASQSRLVLSGPGPSE